MKSNDYFVGLLCFLLLGVSSVAEARDLPEAAPEDVGMSAVRLSRIDAFIERQIENDEFSGATMIVGRKGKIVYKKAFGLADIEENKRMRTDTMFRLCSSSKMISAVAGMILWEEGLFDLLDPVSKYWPEVETSPSSNMMRMIRISTKSCRLKHSYLCITGSTSPVD